MNPTRLDTCDLIQTLFRYIDDLINWIWSFSSETNKAECDSEHLVLIDLCRKLLSIRNEILDVYSKFTKTLQNFIYSRKFIHFLRSK